MKEDEKKKENRIRICIAGAVLVGTSVLAYQIGKKKSMKIYRKHTCAGWSAIADRVTESGENLGLMIPQENGAVKYLTLSSPSEDYDGIVRGFLNLYTI